MIPVHMRKQSCAREGVDHDVTFVAVQLSGQPIEFPVVQPQKLANRIRLIVLEDIRKLSILRAATSL